MPRADHLESFPPVKMDTAIDLSDASKALDLANIRFQLMYTQSFMNWDILLGLHFLVGKKIQ